MSNTVDLTSSFSKTPNIQEVKKYIQDLIDSGEVFNTLNTDWKIDNFKIYDYYKVVL